MSSTFGAHKIGYTKCNTLRMDVEYSVKNQGTIHSTTIEDSIINATDPILNNQKKYIKDLKEAGPILLEHLNTNKTCQMVGLHAINASLQCVQALNNTNATQIYHSLDITSSWL